MKEFIIRLLKIQRSYRRLNEERVKELVAAYLEKENKEALPDDCTTSYDFFSDEWVVNLRPRMRPGCWVTISDKTGEVTGFHNPPR